MLYFGSAVFKITRLLAVAMLCVHCFACAFFRVKKESAASPDDVEQFYLSKGVDPSVSDFAEQANRPMCSASPTACVAGRTSRNPT